MKLIDTLAEQALLEELLESTKPAVPADCAGLHYLLSTPFRYGAPYPSGSRFRRAGLTAGVFYASSTPATAVAELAFHRLLFYADSPGTPWPADAGEYTVFSVRYRTAAGLDLGLPRLVQDRRRWTACDDYSACQQLADDARAAGVEVIRSESVRDPEGRVNVAILTCRAFAAGAPQARQTWRIHLGPHGIRAVCGDPDTRLGFDRAAFARDPRVAALEWDR